MGKEPGGEEIHHTPQGDVRIRPFCTPGEIRALSFDPQFGTHAHYRSLYTKKESLEEKAAQADANVVLAVDETDRIVGFSVLAYPEAQERWAQLQPNVMMEVTAIEVSRSWRRLNIAHRLLGTMLLHPEIEKKIVYMVGYAWTWDLDGEKRSAVQYRQMLIRLFEPFGFIEYETNDPNVCLKPENVFMARIGAEVTKNLQEAFKWLRFGIHA